MEGKMSTKTKSAMSQKQSQTCDKYWPTLAGRLRHSLTSRAEAVRQLQTMMQISATARNVLTREKHNDNKN
jgi:hypothetical protein